MANSMGKASRSRGPDVAPDLSAVRGATGSVPSSTEIARREQNDDVVSHTLWAARQWLLEPKLGRPDAIRIRPDADTTLMSEAQRLYEITYQASMNGLRRDRATREQQSRLWLLRRAADDAWQVLTRTVDQRAPRGCRRDGSRPTVDRETALSRAWELLWQLRAEYERAMNEINSTSVES